jgi:Raf kinase inhibitor-like YbhB/YbcL family protein
MKSMANTIIVTVALAVTFFATENARAQGGVASITVTAQAFQEGGLIPDRFSRNGQNVNPKLRIEGAPENAKSLVLIIDDPDAPAGVFTHWLVWNINPKTGDISEGSLPNGAVQGTNDFPGRGYDGPQPPSGTHRYYFKIFALDTTLNLRPGAKRDAVDEAMKGHVVGQGQLMGRYSKK